VKLKDAVNYAQILIPQFGVEGSTRYQAALAATQLLGDAVGRESDLYRRVVAAENGMASSSVAESALRVFLDLAEKGILSEMSLRRKAEADVTSEILQQANGLLEAEGAHPAAAAVLIGGVLEQFLRSWADEKCLNTSRETIDAYSVALRGAELIDKQDKKDIDAWAGLRNLAAHGRFDQLSKERVETMLAGVNLFLRKHDAAERS
jgi:hypothetical protein